MTEVRFEMRVHRKGRNIIEGKIKETDKSYLEAKSASGGSLMKITVPHDMQEFAGFKLDEIVDIVLITSQTSLESFKEKEETPDE